MTHSCITLWRGDTSSYNAVLSSGTFLSHWVLLRNWATAAWKACSFEWKQLQSLVDRGAQLRGLGSHGLLFRLLALLYDLKVPRWDFQTGRQLRTSPLYDRLDAQGARWMEKHGFERPKYFVPPDKGKKARCCICSFVLRIINLGLVWF